MFTWELREAPDVGVLLEELLATDLGTKTFKVLDRDQARRVMRNKGRNGETSLLSW